MINPLQPLAQPEPVGSRKIETVVQPGQAFAQHCKVPKGAIYRCSPEKSGALYQNARGQSIIFHPPIATKAPVRQRIPAPHRPPPDGPAPVYPPVPATPS